MSRALFMAVVGLAWISGASGSIASQEVVLANGQTLEVQSYRREGNAVIFIFEGGGKLALRSEHVLSIGGQPPREMPAPSAPDVAPVAEAAPALAMPPTAVSAHEAEEPSVLDELITRLAERYDVPALLVAAVIQVESMWDPDAVSPKGAMGLMQLMPATARGHGVTDPFDPAQNVEAGIAELSAQLRRHENEIAMALAAYNAGWVAVKRYQGIPPYRETIRYVEKVLELYFKWSEADQRGAAVDIVAPSADASR